MDSPTGWTKVGVKYYFYLHRRCRSGKKTHLVLALLITLAIVQFVRTKFSALHTTHTRMVRHTLIVNSVTIADPMSMVGHTHSWPLAQNGPLLMCELHSIELKPLMQVNRAIPPVASQTSFSIRFERPGTPLLDTGHPHWVLWSSDHVAHSNNAVDWPARRCI